jgi:hypothetical protein
LIGNDHKPPYEEIAAVTFKENLKAKIKLDRLFRKLVSTIQEPPGQWRLDKVLTQQLLDMTDLEYKKFRDLQLYIRQLEGENIEILVFDNELPIYHTSVADVALRKSPHWQEMFSIRNIRKIMNHHDVLVSKGKESLKRIHANALALLDLNYTRDDLEMLVEDARRGLEQKSVSPIRESLDLFFELLDFQEVFLGEPEQDLQIFAGPKLNGDIVPSFEHLILFDEETLSWGLKKGAFSPQSDSDLAWVIKYSRGEAQADLTGIDVFECLAELALNKAPSQRGGNRGTNDKRLTTE